MIPTSKDFERHPFLGMVMIVAFLAVVTSGATMLAVWAVGKPFDLGLEINWDTVVPIILKFAAEMLVAAYSVFRLLKPIEARLAVVEAKLDLMGSGKELYRILSEEE